MRAVHLGVPPVKKMEWLGAVCFVAGFGLLVSHAVGTSHPDLSRSRMPADVEQGIRSARAGDALLPEAPGPCVVSGAGDSSYDGTYVRAGRCNDAPAYRLDDDHWLWYCHWPAPHFDRGWVLSSAPGEIECAYYSCGSTVGPGDADYFARLGAEPAPTVAVEPPMESMSVEPYCTTNE